MPHKTPTPVKWIPPIGEMEIIGKWGCLLKKVAAVQDLVSQLQAHFEGTLRHTYLYGSRRGETTRRGRMWISLLSWTTPMIQPVMLYPLAHLPYLKPKGCTSYSSYLRGGFLASDRTAALAHFICPGRGSGSVTDPRSAASDFLRTGKLRRDLVREYTRIFEARMTADYGSLPSADSSTAQRSFDFAERFLNVAINRLS